MTMPDERFACPDRYGRMFSANHGAATFDDTFCIVSGSS